MGGVTVNTHSKRRSINSFFSETTLFRQVLLLACLALGTNADLFNFTIIGKDKLNDLKTKKQDAEEENKRLQQEVRDLQKQRIEELTQNVEELTQKSEGADEEFAEPYVSYDDEGRNGPSDKDVEEFDDEDGSSQRREEGMTKKYVGPEDDSDNSDVGSGSDSDGYADDFGKSVDHSICSEVEDEGNKWTTSPVDEGEDIEVCCFTGNGIYKNEFKEYKTWRDGTFLGYKDVKANGHANLEVRYINIHGNTVVGDFDAQNARAPNFRRRLVSVVMPCLEDNVNVLSVGGISLAGAAIIILGGFIFFWFLRSRRKTSRSPSIKGIFEELEQRRID